MEEDDNQNGGNMIPLALAILGIVLGGAGLYFGLTANQRLVPLSESLEAGSSSAARFEKDIASLETRLSELSAQVSEATATVGRLRAYGSQSEQAIKRLASEVGTNREQIVKTAEQLNEWAASGFRPASTRQTESAEESSPSIETSNGSSGPPEGTGSSGTDTYTIKSGDTFARIAVDQGISLQKLLDANPDVDPRRLKIGQKINIPTN